MNIFTDNIFFGLFISLVAFEIGLIIYKKTKFPLFNPLLIAIILVIGFLKIFDIDFDTYNKSGQFINMFLGPATIVLAVPLYKQFELLKNHIYFFKFGFCKINKIIIIRYSILYIKT